MNHTFKSNDVTPLIKFDTILWKQLLKRNVIFFLGFDLLYIYMNHETLWNFHYPEKKKIYIYKGYTQSYLHIIYHKIY